MLLGTKDINTILWVIVRIFIDFSKSILKEFGQTGILVLGIVLVFMNIHLTTLRRSAKIVGLTALPSHDLPNPLAKLHS